MIRITCIMVALAVSGVVSAAQRFPKPAPGHRWGSSWEINTLYVDGAVAEAFAARSNIIAVARLGRGETSSVWNRRRLYNLKTYITTMSWTPELVLTEGQAVDGQGRVELYVAGKRFTFDNAPPESADLYLVAARNRDLWFSDGPDAAYYPWRKAKLGL